MWARVHKKKNVRIPRHRFKEQSRQASYKKSACYTLTLKFLDQEVDYVEVIDSASFDWKLQVKELLYILKKQQELNKQINSEVSDSKTNKTYPQHQVEKE